MKVFSQCILFLVTIMTLLLSPFHLSAQGGIFHRGTTSDAINNDGLLSRSSQRGFNLSNQQFGSDVNGGFNLSNQTFGQEVSLDKGFVIFVIASLGYAAMKSRKLVKKRKIFIIKKAVLASMAFVLIISMSQCGKEKQSTFPTEQKIVHITMQIDGDAKHVVYPETGAVNYGAGDKIYVGNNGRYVGTLTYINGAFTGNITSPSTDDFLHFYFIGGCEPNEVLSEGNTSSFTASIVDQRSKLPVISYGHSSVKYVDGNTLYTCMLMNKCALVKFNVLTSSTSATCIIGMKNKVVIDFSSNSLTPVQEGEGVIKIAKGSGEKWAILLPQDAVDGGNAYSEDGSYTGRYDAVPAISENDYLTSGIVVDITTSNVVDLGLPSGTLWATYNVGAHVPEEYGDYFAWGETQPKETYNWITYQHCNGTYNSLTKYCCNSSYGYNGYMDNLTVLLSSDDAATVNWGSNWRMPTKEEWQELLNNTTHVWTTWNGVKGWLFTSSNNNCLFFPATGSYSDSNLVMVGEYGGYWTSSQTTDSPYPNYNANAWILSGYPDDLHMAYTGYRPSGQSVRAVRSGLNK